VITNITDANCTNTATGTQTITENVLPTATAINGGAVYCAGDVITGITVDVTGTANWTIDYTIDGVPASVVGSSSPINLGNGIGVYVLTDVTDANCTNTAAGTQTITVNPLPTVTAVNGGGTYCAGATVPDITVDVTGTGNWTIDYTLDGVPATANGATSPISLGNAPGVYVVTNVTDANCTNTAAGTQTIIVSATPVLDPIADVNACDSYTLPTITGVDLTGTEAYYDNSQALGGVQITGPLTTSQTVWVYDAVGLCADELSFDVTIDITEDATFSLTNPSVSNRFIVLLFIQYD
jgi:hypothetical protein